MLKILGMGFSFGLSVILAHFLGAEGSGIFFLAFTIVLIISAISRVGMESTLIRFVAANYAEGKLERVLGVYRYAMLWSFMVATILSVLLCLLTPWISEQIFAKCELAQPLAIMALAVVPLTLFTLHAYALQGMKSIAASTLVLSVIVPLVTSVVCVVFVPNHGIDSAAFGYVFATIVALYTGRFFWKKVIRSFKNNIPIYEKRELLSSSMFMFGIVMMNMIITWAPILFLGAWESSENVGIYNAANRAAMLTGSILMAVNTIAAPKFSAFYQKKEFAAIRSLACASTQLIFFLAFPILLIFIFFPERVMAIFGDEFKQGSTVLTILAIGQFFNVITGLSGYLLIMSGHERFMLMNLLGSACLGILLNTLLIPQYGIIGSAISTAVLFSIQNVFSIFLVWKKMNIFLLGNISQ